MDMILFRTHKFDPEVRAFCEQLGREAGLEVVCLVDETSAPLDVAPFRKVALTRPALRRAGLLATADAPWRCGDYGLYLAAQAHPAVERFWLVEYDVRVRTAEPLTAFFQVFDASPADLLAPLLGPRDMGWWWAPAMQVREEPVWGCLFPLLRASAPLLRAAWGARRRQALSPIYRLFWPNDESFLATTAVRAGFTVQDLNRDRVWYTQETFSFERPWSGAELARRPADGLVYHPVLYGEELVRKQTRMAKPITFLERVSRKARTVLRPIA